MTRLPKRRPPSCGPCRASTTRKADDMTSAEKLLEPILALHDSMRDAVVDACAGQTPEQPAATASDHGEGDTIYAIDRVAEAAVARGLSGLIDGVEGVSFAMVAGGSRELLGGL